MEHTDTLTRAATTPTDTSPLAVADRCDRCAAQAYVRATLPSGLTLLFCGHHANAHRASLVGAGAGLHDETDRLLDKRESSAAA